MTQNVSLTGIPGITDSQIDGGLISAEISFWEQGLNQGNPSDDGFVTLTFRNSANIEVGSFTSPEIDSFNLNWQEFTGSVAVPVGTRSIDYTMHFTRHVGFDLDALRQAHRSMEASNMRNKRVARAAGKRLRPTLSLWWATQQR